MRFLNYFKKGILNLYCINTSNTIIRGMGFTVVEMLIVLTIATLVMASVVIQQYSWNDNLALNTQSYDVVLSIRQAQIYSLGVKEYKDAIGDKFDIGYGIYFDMDSPNQYISFVDKDKNTKYDPINNESVEIKDLKNGVYIYKICGVNSGGNEKCSDNGSLEKVEISFYRPEPKAHINFLNSGGNNVSSIYPPAKIYLKSSGGREIIVKVEENGQISIQ